MVTVRTAKSKGNSLEYDVQYSLGYVYGDIYLTKERGFQRQFDLCSDDFKVAIECKRLKGISWNQAVKFYEKLVANSPEGYINYLVFKSNHQPCLVLRDFSGKYIIETFEDCFNTKFLKHVSTRKKVLK